MAHICFSYDVAVISFPVIRLIIFFCWYHSYMTSYDMTRIWLPRYESYMASRGMTQIYFALMWIEYIEHGFTRKRESFDVELDD